MSEGEGAGERADRRRDGRAAERDGERPAAPARSVLIIDDDVEFCRDVAALLAGRYRVLQAHDVSAGREAILREAPDVVLLDIDFGPQAPNGGLELLARLDGQASAPEVIVLSGIGRAPVIVEAIKRGALHYVCKPPDPGELGDLIELALERADSRLRLRAQQVELERRGGELVAEDPRSLALLEQMARVAATDQTVLITGESGTGKEMIARALHRASRRADGPFLVVNCAAIQPTLLESELFGHRRGSYTGAVSDEPGKFELARGGTICLDEIGEAPTEIQAKLLRAIEYRVMDVVGAALPRQVDVRVLATTNRSLEKAVEERAFRRDLFYRLNVFRLHVPALRERPGDLLPLARHFLRQYAREFGRDAEDFTEEAVAHLREREWPGNVRELQYAVARFALQSRARLVGVPDLHPTTEAPELGLPYEEARRRFQEAYCRRQLAATGGNVTRAAELSGLPRQSFQRLLRRLGIDPAAYRE